MHFNSHWMCTWSEKPLSLFTSIHSFLPSSHQIMYGCIPEMFITREHYLWVLQSSCNTVLDLRVQLLPYMDGTEPWTFHATELRGLIHHCNVSTKLSSHCCAVEPLLKDTWIKATLVNRDESQIHIIHPQNEVTLFHFWGPNGVSIKLVPL